MSHESAGHQREVPELSYEIASRVVDELCIKDASVLSAKDMVDFFDAVDRSITPDILGEQNMWLRKRGIIKGALWYAAQITMNSDLLTTAWDQESARIRRRNHPKRTSIALRYPG